MAGLERTLALSTHLFLNSEIITQAPSLKGARVLIGVSEPGSWKIPAYIAAGSSALFAIGSLEANNPIGHAMYSLYDYIVREAVGLPVDYQNSLVETYNQAIAQGAQGFMVPEEPKLAALVEKVESALTDVHRPLINSVSADQAIIGYQASGSHVPAPLILNRETYSHLRYSERDTSSSFVHGKVASYNLNTFKGRFFSLEEGRPIPFNLLDVAKTSAAIKVITSSLRANAIDQSDDTAIIKMSVVAERGKTGRVKNYRVQQVLG